MDPTNKERPNTQTDYKKTKEAFVNDDNFASDYAKEREIHMANTLERLVNMQEKIKFKSTKDSQEKKK